MTSITEHYKISGDVPFHDVDVSKDNRLFLDPHAIRLARTPSPFSDEANRATATFFKEITACALSRDPAERQRGLDLLQHFEEPWETRMGLAKEGFRGHGGSADVGKWIWDALITDVEALVRIGAMRQIEDLPLFVDGIDRDITSDVTTRIAFEPLCNFTASMVARYSEFTSGGHKVDTFERQVWDSTAGQWTMKTVELPIANGKPLLLVPRGWARPTLLMSATRFYETSVLTYAQLEQAAISPSGELLTTPKRLLKEQKALARGRSTNLRVTIDALRNEEDLIAMFRAFVDSRYDNEEDRRTA